MITDELAGIVARRAAELAPDPQRVLDIGCGGGEIKRGWKGGQPSLWVHCDCAVAPLRLAAPAPGIAPDLARCLSEVESLPFADNSFDLAIGYLVIHHLNEPPNWLARLAKIIKPGGILLLATPLAGLGELQRAFAAAELAVEKHFSPLIDMPTLAALLLRCGFSEPVVDKEKLHLQYRSPLTLLQDLRTNGEANVLLSRPRHLIGKAKLQKALGLFAAANPTEFNITAEFLIAAAFKSA